MSSNGNYPPGAQYDPAAPWNDVETVTRRVTISVTYSKEVEVELPKDYNEQNLEEHVRDQVTLPREAMLTLSTVLQGRYKRDCEGWIEDDFAIVE